MKFVIPQYTAFILLVVALPALLSFLLLYVAINGFIKKLFRRLSHNVYIYQRPGWELE